MTGQRQGAGARHPRRLDEEHVSARWRPRQPIATPGSFVRSSISSSMKEGAPASPGRFQHGVIVSGDSSPSARRRAALRQSAPISRSRFLTPASLVPRMTARRASSVIVSCSAVRPTIGDLLLHEMLAGDRQLLFLGVTGISSTSILSRSAGGRDPARWRS